MTLSMTIFLLYRRPAYQYKYVMLTIQNKACILRHYYQFCYAECRYAECRYAEFRYAECRYAECRFAECHYAECRYAECRGAAPLH